MLYEVITQSQKLLKEWWTQKHEEKRAEILAEVPLEDRLALRAALDFEEETA